MTFYVYILRSETTDKFYIGQTHDLDKRLEDHNKGRSNYTKPFRPWSIIAYKEVASRSEAVKLEGKIKNIKAKQGILQFISKNKFELLAGPEK